MTLPIGAPRVCALLIAATVLMLPVAAAVAAPAARAASLPLVWSDSYVSAAGDAYNAAATGPDGAVYAAGVTGADAAGAGGQLLLAKYVDTGASMSREWVRTYARAGFTAASATKVAVDASGNVIVAGTLGTPSLAGVGSDIVVLKYSSAGVLIWAQVYDGPAHRGDYVKGLALDAVGDAFVVGASAGKGTGRDYVTIKIDAGGSRPWLRRFAGPGDYDEARGVAVDPAGNVYVTGESMSASRTPRVATISYSAAGARRWLVIDRRARASAGAAVLFANVPGAKGVVVSGWRYLGRPQYEDYFFAKYAPSSGKLIWLRTFGNGRQATEEPLAAALDGAGAPMAAGMSNKLGIQGYLAGVSASGHAIWRSTFASDFADPGWAEFDSIAANAGGGVLAGGWTQAAAWDLEPQIPSAFLVRYSPSSPVTEPLDYVGPGGATSHDKCTAVAIGANGMYAVGQQTSATDDLDAVLLKF